MIVIIMRYKHLKRKGRKSGVRVILIKRERFGNFGNIMLMPSPCKRLETHYSTGFRKHGSTLRLQPLERSWACTQRKVRRPQSRSKVSYLLGSN